MPLAFLFTPRGHVALEQVAHVSDAPAFLFALRGVICVHVAAKGSAMPSRFVCPAGIRTLLGARGRGNAMAFSSAARKAR